MTARSDDNVVYVDFAAAKRVDTPSTAISDGQSTQPTVATPMANKWLDWASESLTNAIEIKTDSGRIKRGVEYSEQGKVGACTVEPNIIRGTVQGANEEPYVVRIQLEPLAPADRDDAHEYLNAHPDLWTALSRGEMDQRLAYLLGLTITPSAEAHCNCPDPAWVCKHAVALVHTAVALMRSAPELFPLLRGFTASAGEGEGATKLSHPAVAESDESENNDIPELSESEQRAEVEEATRRFWIGGELPDLPALDPKPMLDDSDMSLLHEAIRSISYTTLDELRVVSEIEDMYYALTHDAHLPPLMGE